MTEYVIKAGTKLVPPHIFPKWDPEYYRFGMWNERLKQWVGFERPEGHPIFRTEEEAIEWFKDQI